MPRTRLRLSVVAPVLAVVFALAAIGLVVTSRPLPPPRQADLLVLEGTVRAQPLGLHTLVGAARLSLLSRSREHIIDAAGCSKPAGALRPGEPVSVWVDAQSRAWRISRGTTPLCTFLQAVAADDAARHTRRVGAVVLAVIGVGCAGVAMATRSRRG